MHGSELEKRAVAARLPTSARLQIVSPCPTPPRGPHWLHEIKHDGHRLTAIISEGGSLRLLSRRGLDRTALFRTPFRKLASAARTMVLDGEIAIPDDRGVTHLDALTDALAGKQAERPAYFAFDLLYLDGHDLRRCPIEHRKAALRQVLDDHPCERVIYVDHVIGRGDELFAHVRAIGAEGIVSKRMGQPYRGGESRDWLKTKCSEIGRFVVTGFQELGEGRLEAIHVAEERDDGLHPVGQVRFGFAGKGLRSVLDALREGRVKGSVVTVPPVLSAEAKFFGGHQAGSIRDGVILALAERRTVAHARLWCCDCDDALAAYDVHD